ncbi:MAG: hypothetical protein IVW57_15570 [Ktedonobacterales bacterium]|nr:hypothetical protein [Ktedonobacterales bacterium]
MSHHILVLIVEDVDAHYQDIYDYVTEECKSLGVTPTIARPLSKVEIEARLEHGQGVMPALIIFDVQMEGPGGMARLDGYIRSLWNAPPTSWRGQVPILIFSTFADQFAHLPKRAHSTVVRKIPRGEEDTWELLRLAIRESVSALLVRE